jgi:hypothetical protein
LADQFLLESHCQSANKAGKILHEKQFNKDKCHFLASAALNFDQGNKKQEL